MMGTISGIEPADAIFMPCSSSFDSHMHPVPAVWRPHAQELNGVGSTQAELAHGCCAGEERGYAYPDLRCDISQQRWHWRCPRCCWLSRAPWLWHCWSCPGSSAQLGPSPQHLQRPEPRHWPAPGPLPLHVRIVLFRCTQSHKSQRGVIHDCARKQAAPHGHSSYVRHMYTSLASAAASAPPLICEGEDGFP